MDDKDWRLLVALARERGVTRAARKLYVTQPAATRRLQQIEREMNCAVVVRGTRGVELSAEGERLAAYAAEELSRLETLRQYIDNCSETVRGTIRLACANAYALSMLPALLKRFRAAFPEVDVHVVTGHSRYVERRLDSGEAQIAIVRGRSDWKEESFELSADPYYYIVSSAPVDLERLPGLPQIRIVTDAPLEAELRRWWTERYRLPPKISTVVDRSDICIEMVRRGLGYSMLSGLYIGAFPGLRRERVVFSSGSALYRGTRACCRASSLKVRAVREFWNFLRERGGQAE